MFVVSCNRCYKLSQTGYLKAIKIYSLTVLDARHLQSRYQQGHSPHGSSRGKFFPASLNFWQVPAFSGFLGLWNSNLCLHLHITVYAGVSLYSFLFQIPFVFLRMTLVIGFGTYLGNSGLSHHLKLCT